MPIFALAPDKAITQYNLKVWQTEQGLPQNIVISLQQTRDGYLWLGTQEGLVRFDGVHFRTFNKQNTAQIKNNIIQAICEDSNGNLWFGTDEGLVKYSSGEFTLYTTENGLSNNMVTALYADRAGNVWIGTRGGGLNRFDNNSFTSWSTDKGLSNNRVYAIHEDSRGALWVGTGAGLNRFENFVFTDFSYKTDFAEDVVLSLTEDKRGNLWVGTRQNGLKQLNGNTLNSYTTKNGLASNFILKVLADKDENLWVGTYGGGLQRMQKDGKFTALPFRDELPINVVISIIEDNEGNLWVGTETAGLIRLSDGKFTTFTTQEGLSDNLVWSVYEAGDGAMWVGTNNGLNRFLNGKFDVYTTRNGLAQNIAWAFGEDLEGGLWIGTRGGGASYFKDNKFTNYTTKNGLLNDMVRAVYTDAQGNVWLGTAGGLNKFKDGKLTAYTTADGLASNNIFAVQGDNQGNLWIGTQGGGLSLYRNGKFSTYDTRNGLASNLIYALYLDRAGDLWIGTDNGLSCLKFDNQDETPQVKINSFTSRNGLFSDLILSVSEDDNGQLWMSSLKGIFSVARFDIDKFIAQETELLVSKVYGKADGLKSAECNGGSQPASWRGRDGRLWFPTTKGVAFINPSSIQQNAQLPPVYIEELLAGGKVLPLKGEAILAPENVNLEFRYTALSFSAPERVRFRYRLEGFDEDWIDAGDRRTAFYTNLSPGSYRFHVIAANNDGVWNETGAVVEFKKQPFFYQTVWFYGLCTLSLIVGIASLSRWRIHRRLRQIEEKHQLVLQERNRLAREVHDTLTQGLTGIMAQLQAARNAARNGHEQNGANHVQTAHELAKENLAEARRWIQILSDDALNNNNLSAALLDFARKIEKRNFVKVNCSIESLFIDVPPETMEHILRIAQEAINNAVKYADAKNINIKLRCNLNNITLNITDDGRGFEVDKLNPDSFGLRSMRERAALIKGDLQIESRLNQGTSVYLTVPLGTNSIVGKN